MVLEQRRGNLFQAIESRGIPLKSYFFDPSESPNFFISIGLAIIGYIIHGIIQIPGALVVTGILCTAILHLHLVSNFKRNFQQFDLVSLPNLVKKNAKVCIKITCRCETGGLNRLFFLAVGSFSKFENSY